MGLETTVLNLSFLKGIQTSTDAKLELQGELQDLQNAYFTRIGEIRKRNGFDQLTTAYPGGSITSGNGLAVYDNELTAFDGSNVYSYSPGMAQWINRGLARSAIVTNAVSIANDYAQTCASIAYNAGIEVHVWEDERGGIRYNTIDSLTRTYIVSDGYVAGGYMPKVYTVGPFFVCLYANADINNNTQLRYVTMTSVVPTAWGAPLNFATNLHATNQYFDGVISGGKLFVAWNTNTASIRTNTIDNSLIVGSELQKTVEVASGGISLHSDSNNNVYVSYYDGTNLKYYVVSFTNTIILNPVTIETIANVKRFTGYSGTTTNVYYEISAASTYNTKVRKATVDLSGMVTIFGDFKRSVGLAAKVFGYNNDSYIPLTHDSNNQATYFIVNSTGREVAKVSPGIGGGLLPKLSISAVVTQSPGVFLFPNSLKGAFKSDRSNFFSKLGVNVSKIDFTARQTFSNATLGKCLHIVGGILQTYDGANLYESNFHLYPEDASFAQSVNMVGGLTVGASYQYAIVYSYTDNKGQLTQSATSIAQTVAMTSTNNQVTITVPTLRLTARSNVMIEIYRTAAFGSVFYMVTSSATPTYNDPTVDSIQFVDNLSDSVLIGNKPLYTTGELYNSAPSSCSIARVYKNRLFLAGLDDPNLIEYSKINVSGIPVNFQETFRIRIPPLGGKITDLYVLDDKLIVFKETAIYYIVGDGFNNAGGGSDFSLPQRVASDVGCSASGLVTETPDGLAFVSKKGIFLLNRGLGTSKLGAEVTAYQDLTFVSVDLVPDKNQVRFASQEGTILVYDYFFRLWFRFTGLSAVDAIAWSTDVTENAYVLLNSSGQVLVESQTSFTDAGNPIKTFISTGWFSPAGPQGYVQLHALSLVGEYITSHTLTVNLYYNYIDSSQRTYVISPDNIVNSGYYGSDTYYGANVYGGSFNNYQFSMKPNQKLESFRITIEDDQTAGNYGECFRLSNLRVEVAGMPGSLRVPASNKGEG